VAYEVYYDESGDLGWNLSQPFGKGGSSRYFTIGYMIITSENKKRISRFLKDFHKARGGKNREIKGASISNKRAKIISNNIANRLLRYDDVILGAITVKKENVPAPLKNGGNDHLLYNYMLNCCLPKLLKGYDEVTIIPDKRSVPKGSVNSCPDSIKTELWFREGCSTKLTYTPKESQTDDGLMFIDWIANFVWRNHENAHDQPYNRLKGMGLVENQLFF
jgi:hypothetical protein